MFLKKTAILLLLFWSASSIGQTKIKSLFYNTLNYDSNLSSQNRTHHLKTILDEVEPDLFMVCEIKNETASNYIYVNAVLPYKESFKKAPFNYSQSPATGLLQMVYYNSKKLVLESTKVIPTETRDINHYTFKINTVNITTTPIRIEVFVTHLKASSGLYNRNKRLSSIGSFVRELDRLPKNSNVIFAGDFNFYTSNEDGFKKLIDASNSIKMIDPINRLCPTFPIDGKDYFDADYDSTYFWNNFSFRDVHTQSTRTSQLNGDGAGGGMDDRFDFIMISENFKTNSNLYYKEGSYKSVGNNGNCYNSYVSNTSCSGDFSQNLRTALYNFSDHLPVVMEIETPENTLSTNKYKQPLVFTTTNSHKNNISLKTNFKVNNVSVFNFLGQIVKEVNFSNLSEKNINISNFSKGVYFIKADNYKPIKFIKL